MLSILRYGYKATKPRLPTINTKNLQAYRKQMHEARVRAHTEAVKYLNRIQDEFLQNHKKKTEEEHFNNECRFRAKIARNSYILFEQIQQNRSKHEQKLQMIQKYIRGEQIKRLNRNRIRKILEYESKNFWLNGDTVTQKFISERVVPQFVGSTEYYHKLHSQAFAYEELDFNLLHKLSSNEESVKYKNQLLIPIFKEVLFHMRMVKFSDEERLNKEYKEIQIKARKKYSHDPAQLSLQLERIKNEHETKLINLKKEQISIQTKRQYFKNKLTDLIILLKKWKEYTDILSMTSAEVLQIIEQSRKQTTISDRRKILETEIQKNRDKTFVKAVEEDTEDQQLSLQSFLIKTPVKSTAEPPRYQQDFNAQLANLLERQRSVFDQIALQLQQKQTEIKTQFSSSSWQKQAQPIISSIEGEQKPSRSPQSQLFNQKLWSQVQKQRGEGITIDENCLKANETTASIEVLKQQYKNDQVLKNLLNIAGEINLEYPKLFRKIWDNQIV